VTMFKWMACYFAAVAAGLVVVKVIETEGMQRFFRTIGENPGACAGICALLAFLSLMLHFARK